MPQYNSWIRVRKLVILGLMTLGLLLLLVTVSSIIIKLFIFSLLLIVGYILVIVGLSYYYFTAKHYQALIHSKLTQLTELTDSDLKLLDIGAGSGSLAIMLATKYPTANIQAIDYWGDDWEYSKALCEDNARIEQVDNIDFTTASASNLPFESNTFNYVTSCLTFHEVKDANSIYDVISEANRVLANGGHYLYLDDHHYPLLNDHLSTILGDHYQLIKLDQLIDLPFVLKHKKVLGKAAVIIGQKKR